MGGHGRRVVLGGGLRRTRPTRGVGVGVSGGASPTTVGVTASRGGRRTGPRLGRLRTAVASPGCRLAT